jgi:hypothetical protein
MAGLLVERPEAQPAILRARPKDTIPGPDPGNIRWLVHGRLAAATMWPSSATVEPLAHAALLAEIHAQIGILPARYGTVAASEEAVRDFLGNHRDNLLRDLLRLEGTGEIGLRVDLADLAATPHSRNEDRSHPPASLPGQYLALRRQRYASIDRLARQARLATEDFVQAMHGLFCDCRTLSSTVPTVVRLAFLVRRDLWATFRNRIAALMPGRASQRCTLLGPWPPYSFV